MKNIVKILFLLLFLSFCLLWSNLTRADEPQSARIANKDTVRIKLKVAPLIKVSFLNNQFVVETNSSNIVVISSNNKTGQRKKTVVETDGLFLTPFQEEIEYTILPEV
jgi:hypothetical protein